MRAGFARVGKTDPSRVPLHVPLLRRSSALFCAATLLLLLSPAGAGVAKPPPADLLDDAPEVFRAKRPQTEPQRDRVEAEALFAAGRLLERRQDYAGALRKYERALRRDPTATPVLSSLLQVALRTSRVAEADRYARKLADVPNGDLFLLSRIAMRMAEQGHWEAAVKIYEKVLATSGGDKPAVTDFVLRMELGKLYHLLEKDDKAADHFARVLEALKRPEQFGVDQRLRKELLSDPAPLYRLIGECFLGAGRVDAAIDAFRQAEAAKSDKPAHAFGLARAELRAGRADKALKQLQIYFDARSLKEGVEPYRVLSDALAALKKTAELGPRLEKIRAADPGNVPLAYFLAEHYRRAGELDKAEKLYAAMIKKAPTLIGYRGLVDVYRKTNRPEPLLATLGQAVEKYSGLEPLGAEGEAVAKDSALVRRLIELARQQRKADPRRPEYPQRLALALLAAEAKLHAEAGELFELAIQARPSQAAELLLQWGLSLLAGEKSLEAAKVFQRGTQEKVRPEIRAAFYYYWIAALGAAEHYDEALATARKAAAEKKDSARLAGRVGWVLFLMKRYDEAGKQYRELLERFDRDHTSQEIRLTAREARLILSNIANLQNRPAEAEEWLEQVLDEFPDDPSASNDLGYLWAERGAHLERAWRLIQVAIADEPDNKAYRDSLGWVYYQRGQYREAVIELEKAAADKKPDGVVLEHLGDAYLKAGQAQKAKDAWRKAVKLLRREKDEKKALEVEKKLK